MVGPQTSCEFNIRSLNKGGFVMPVDQRDAWVRAYLEDVFNGHNLQSLDKYMTEDLVSHWLGDRSVRGRGAWRKAMANFFDAFPDAAYTLNDLFCAGDKGVWRGTWDATQRKEWEGIPAKGRKAKWTVIIIGRFERDKIAEDWVEYDRYNLFRQLEAV
jgi:predicted ester cyclase